jgi:RES domain-containing protein
VALDVDPIAMAGEWILHAPHRSGLLRRSPEATDGRWQRGELVRGLYLADESHIAVAEWYRYLAERGLPPSAAIAHDHHVWRVHLTLADLSTAERLAAVGLRPPRLTRRDGPPYPDIGEELWRNGWRGVLAPSAARPTARPSASSATTGRPPAARRCEPSRSPKYAHPPRE